MLLAYCQFPRCRVECEIHSPAHLHKGVTYTVLGILTFIKRLTGLYLQSLHHRFIAWTKPDTISLLLGTLTDLTRSKPELVAEKALLRQQLLILRRHMKRPVCTNTDRMLLGKNGLCLETSPLHHSARDVTGVASPGISALLEVQIQSSCSHTKDLR